MKSENWASNLSINDRVSCAEKKVAALIDRVAVALKTRASNRLMKFPIETTLPSASSTMFNHLQVAMYKFEALELRALWDKNSAERNSIPTVVYLLKDQDVKAELRCRVENEYPDFDPDGDLTSYYRMRRDEEVQKFEDGFKKVFALCDHLERDPNFARLREFRDYQIAHSISKANTLLDPTKIYLAEPFWDQTIACISSLNTVVRRSSFDFDGSAKFADKLARSWWEKLQLHDTYLKPAPAPSPSLKGGEKGD